MKDVYTQESAAERKADHHKTLVIEHPVRQGWKLVAPAKADETTETLYRFKGKVAAGKATKLKVQQELVRGEVIAISPLDISALTMYVRNGQIPKEVRDALAGALAARQAVAETERQIAERQQRLQEIAQGQNRIRDNMKALDAKSDYYQRLLKKLNEEETKIDKLQTEMEDLRTKLEKQRNDMEESLQNMNVG
jgi:chromosome segregation ATPase